MDSKQMVFVLHNATVPVVAATVEELLKSVRVRREESALPSTFICGQCNVKNRHPPSPKIKPLP